LGIQQNPVRLGIAPRVGIYWKNVDFRLAVRRIYVEAGNWPAEEIFKENLRNIDILGNSRRFDPVQGTKATGREIH